MKNLTFLDSIGKIMVMIVQTAYLNLLWILFSFLGLVLLGFAPSTLAMFTVTREWINGDTDIPIFKTFWISYRTNFITSNFTFYIIVVLGAFLYLYWSLIQSLNGILYYLITAIFISGLVLYLILLLYIFPTMTQFNIKLFQYFKYALLIGIASPIHTILMMIFVASILVALYLMPIFTPLYSGVIISLVTMFISLNTFRKKAV